MKKELLFTDLSDEQAEKVVGGVGLGTTGGNSAGFAGWFGGTNAADGDQGLSGAGQGFAPNPMSHGRVSVVHPR